MDASQLSTMPDPRHVAVALVYSPSAGKILMITSRAHPQFWIVPKGGIEKGEASGEAAVREAWEEAGTPSSLSAPNDEDEILQLTVEPAKGHSRGSVWHVHVINVDVAAVDAITEWPERHERLREWVTLEECLRRIRAWKSDAEAAERLDGPASVHDKKGSRKKEIKGEAMEMAVRAFADQAGLILPP